jgi:exosortase/archaeosortase family protein
MRSGAAIIFAVTIPELWARMLFAAVSNYVLQIDALLVSLFVGTRPEGNLVPFANSAGMIIIAPGCSSISNVSLALLCTAAYANFYHQALSARLLLRGLFAVLAVVAINVVRVGLIGIEPSQYDLIHGTIGATIAGWVTAITIVAVSSTGLRAHETRHA